MDLNFYMSLRIIFTWWHRQTFGTFLKTLLTGKFVGKDEFGNKYYRNKKDERWVVYADKIEATKITSNWYLWMHHTIDKIPDEKNDKKYSGKKAILKIKQALKKVINQSKLQRKK